MTMRKLMYVLGAVAVLALGPVLSACNTTEGAGEDISAAGKAMSNTAEKTKQSM